jgi:hypothetical protein
VRKSHSLVFHDRLKGSTGMVSIFMIHGAVQINQPAYVAVADAIAPNRFHSIDQRLEC